MKIDIVGAGMAGLLAGKLLAHHGPLIYEAQPKLPNNHSAILRFRTNKVGEALKIPFKKVHMIKATLPWRNPIADALSYSLKNTGTIRSDRSINAGMVSEERYIAPSNLIEEMAQHEIITYACSYHFLQNIERKKSPIISTIPMPILMDKLDYPGPKVQFTHFNGTNITAKVASCDAYVSLIIPDPKIPFSRISLTGDQLIIEIPKKMSNEINQDIHDIIGMADYALGIGPMSIHKIRIHKAHYAKIAPIDENIRRDFIYWATDQHNIFSLGRFATWRPGLLLDDLVKDIGLIDRWISIKDKYAVGRHR